MLRILTSVGLLCASAMAMAGEVKYDSIYDKFPLPDAFYTANGDYFRITGGQRNLMGLEPPFTITARFITTNDTPNKPSYHVMMRVDVCLADEMGLPLETGPQYYNQLYLIQYPDTDTAYFIGQMNGADITPIALNVAIHDIESFSIRVNADGSHTALMKVKNSQAETPIMTIAAPFENSVLYVWQVSPYRTVWLDTVTLTGPNVADRNGGEDVHKFRDSNGDGETNAVDIQFIINAVLGIGK